LPLGRGNNECTTFGGTALLKVGKAKNVQNSARFRTAIEFDREYLWNELRYKQAVNGVIKQDHPGVEQKIGELWSTNKNVIGAHVGPP